MGGRGWAVPRLPRLCHGRAGCSGRVLRTPGAGLHCSAFDGYIRFSLPSLRNNADTWQEALPCPRLSTYGTEIPGGINFSLWIERHTKKNLTIPELCLYEEGASTPKRQLL